MRVVLLITNGPMKNCTGFAKGHRCSQDGSTPKQHIDPGVRGNSKGNKRNTVAFPSIRQSRVTDPSVFHENWKLSWVTLAFVETKIYLSRLFKMPKNAENVSIIRIKLLYLQNMTETTFSIISRLMHSIYGCLTGGGCKFPENILLIVLYSVENFTYVTVMNPRCLMHESFPKVTVTGACRIEGNATVVLNTNSTSALRLCYPPLQVHDHAQGELRSKWGQIFQQRLKQNAFVQSSPLGTRPVSDVRQVGGLLLRRETFLPDRRSDQDSLTKRQ
jgi:hypothetical protein